MGLSPVSRLPHLSDVDTSGVADGQTLVWDDTAGVWVPGTVTGGDGAGDSASLTGLVPIGPTIGSVDTADGVTLNLDHVFGIDTDGDPYYDPAAPAEGEEAILFFDRATCAYVILPWCDSDDAIPDPDLDEPDFYTRTLLITPTYDGSGQTVHPDVLKVDGGWNGWLYWMGVTPFPFSDTQLENPSILVSNDGFDWEEPEGITNPIVPSPSGSDYNADPDIVRDASGRFWLFYMARDSSNMKNWVIGSVDGITWDDPVLLFSGPLGSALSPTVVHDGDTWKMWSIDRTVSPNVMRLRTAPTPEGPWSSPTACAASAPSGRDLWHLDVIADGEMYRAIINTSPSGTHGGVDGRIMLGSSADGVDWATGPEIMEPSESGWDETTLYRGTALYEQGRWRLWFGGKDSSGAWRTGYTELPADDFPEAP